MPPQCLDYRCVPSYLVYGVLGLMQVKQKFYQLRHIPSQTVSMAAIEGWQNQKLFIWLFHVKMSQRLFLTFTHKAFGA